MNKQKAANTDSKPEYKHIIRPVDNEYMIGQFFIRNDEYMLKEDEELNELYYKNVQNEGYSLITDEEGNKLFNEYEVPVEYKHDEIADEYEIRYYLKNINSLNNVDDDEEIRNFDLKNYIAKSKYTCKDEKKFIEKLLVAYEYIRKFKPNLLTENILNLLEGGFKIDKDSNCRAYILDNTIFYNLENLYDEENDLVHELIHIFSKGYDSIGFYDCDEYRRAINEGFTELYAVRAQGIKQEFDLYTGTARTLEIIFEKDYTDAYFYSDSDALYEGAIDNKKLMVLFEALDKKMYYDGLGIDNNINYYAQIYIIDIMFEKIHNEILDNHYKSIGEILNKLDEVRDILSNDEMREKYQESFDIMFDAKYDEIIELYLNQNQTNNDVKNANDRIDFGKITHKDRDYKIYLIDGEVKYLFNVNNEEIEASKFISAKFDEMFNGANYSAEILFDPVIEDKVNDEEYNNIETLDEIQKDEWY